jgi:dual specificity tyrosine-phosphorylation-regulated kinase 2/3/4
MRRGTQSFRASPIDCQVEETIKLKKSILEFSQRLENAQMRLGFGENRICTRRGRRFSCDFDRDLENCSGSCFQSGVRKRNEKGKGDLELDVVFPISSKILLKSFKECLSPYEQGEALEFKKIYYFGQSSEKIKSFSSKLNFCYDDERGDYKIIKNDHIFYRFEILEPLGKGAFGQVVKVFDHKTKEPLALKIIKNKSRLSEQAETEVKILEILQQDKKILENHIVQKRKSFIFRSHFCIVFDLLGPSLYSVLHSNCFQGLDERIIKKIAFQVFEALNHLSTKGIIHCDLKPENILTLTHSKTSVKVIDLGSACFVNKKLFNYIQSRFYRAPEVVLGLEYNEAIDIWSFGCVLAELFTGRPIFPGQDEGQLVGLMVEALGPPPLDLVKESKRLSMFFYSDLKPRARVSKNSSLRLDQILRGASLEFFDLVKSKSYLGCLAWTPQDRINAKDAMSHRFFFDWKNEEVVQTVVKPLFCFNRSSALTDKHKGKSFVF